MSASCSENMHDNACGEIVVYNRLLSIISHSPSSLLSPLFISYPSPQQLPLHLNPPLPSPHPSPTLSAHHSPQCSTLLALALSALGSANSLVEDVSTVFNIFCEWACEEEKDDVLDLIRSEEHTSE